MSADEDLANSEAKRSYPMGHRTFNADQERRCAMDRQSSLIIDQLC